MNLLLLLALVLGDGSTPHSALLNWRAVSVIDVNDDGSTFSRPPLGYYVYRAQVGVQGGFAVINQDVVVGMLNDDGTLADCSYEDTEVVGGATYVYAVSAVDFGGESALSAASEAVTIPVNPNPVVIQAVTQ